jgi:hypothetical protein
MKNQIKTFAVALVVMMAVAIPAFALCLNTVQTPVHTATQEAPHRFEDVVSYPAPPAVVEELQAMTVKGPAKQTHRTITLQPILIETSSTLCIYHPHVRTCYSDI